jgi:hypothetical protein
MRYFTVLLICLASGCCRTSSDPASPAPPVELAPIPKGLYTDDEIRKLADFDIDKESDNARALFDIRCLDVVPNGKSYPRAKVFKMLNLDDARLRGFWSSGFDFVDFLTWQVSPSYDICCMTAINDPENDDLELTDPKRKVYGIRLLKHREYLPSAPP